MRLLVDTHVMLWALAEPARLGPEARALLEDPANEVLFSAASIWEIAIKASLGRADFPFQPTRIAQEALALGFIELPVAWAAAARFWLSTEKASCFSRVIWYFCARFSAVSPMPM